MPSELRPLVRPLSLRGRRCHGPALYRGSVGRIEVVAALAGIGTRAAARTAERVLDARGVDHVVVVGIAGGIGGSVEIGDVVVPEVVVDLSTGTDYRPALLGDIEPLGILATSDRLLVDGEEIARLRRQGVTAIDMETAAVAAVCERRGCPWSVVRAISDRAGDGSIDQAVLGLTRPDGAPNLPALARFVLSKPWRTPQLARLAGNMRRAAANAAATAVRGLERA
jgi:adenosylhomocysteine nucleosidase